MSETVHLGCCLGGGVGQVVVVQQDAQRLAHDAEGAPEHDVADLLELRAHQLAVQYFRDVNEWDLQHHTEEPGPQKQRQQ